MTPRLRSAPLAGALVLAVLAPSLRALQDAPPLPEPPDPSRPVITIDGEPIPAGVFGTWLMQHRGELMAPVYAQDWLIEREAARLGLGVTNEEVYAEVERSIGQRVKGTFGGDRSAWVRSLQRVGRSEQGLLKERYLEQRRDLLASLIASVDRVVPPEKIERDWEREYGPGGVRLRVRRIEIPFETPAVPLDATDEEIEAALDAARAEQRRAAEALRDELVAGADFGAAAREHGRSAATAPSQGLPLIAEEWSPEILDELYALHEGAIAGPYFDRNAFILFELTKRVVTPFEDVRDEIEARLRAAGPEGDEIADRAQALVDAAHIEILPSMWASPAPGSLSRPPDEIVLLVDGTPIRRAEFVLWLTHSEGEQMVTRFVDYWTVHEHARERGLDRIDPEELERRVEESFELDIEYHYHGKKDDWLSGILSTGRTVEGWRRETALRVERDILAERLLLADRVVDPIEVRGEWLDRYGPEGRRIDASVIQLDTPLPARGDSARGRGSDDEDRSQATLERLVALRERVLAGEDFAELARENSDAHNAEDGGRFADGLRPEQWPSYVADEVAKLEPGGVSEPVQVGSSWYLFQLHGIEEHPFESEREAIEEELRTRRPNELDLAGFRNVLTRDLKVKILPALFDETRQ